MEAKKDPLTPRLVKRMQGDYVPAEFTGNQSGYLPLGKKVMVIMDQAAEKHGSVELPPEVVERMSLASESGILIESGPEAFDIHGDGSRWHGCKPVAGDHVIIEKYAGLLILGDDGLKYRIMEDTCIGAVRGKATNGASN